MQYTSAKQREPAMAFRPACVFSWAVGANNHSLRRPVLTLHREAITGTVDPETVITGNLVAPTQEGGPY